MKRLPTPLLLAGSLLLSTATASAQTTFRLGVRGGANRALTTLADASNSPGTFPFSYSANKSAIFAWQAGVVAEANFGKLALQPALVFSQKGEQFRTTIIEGDFVQIVDERTSTNRYNWLELPLNVVYTLHGDHGLQVFAGPYVAYAVGGRQEGTATTNGQDLREFEDKIAYGSGTNNQRVDIGFNVGLGYRQGPVQVQLGYGLGLRNLHQAGPRSIDPSFSIYHDFNADAAHNRVAQLTGTYFFSL
jgi:hypothetical protein